MTHQELKEKIILKLKQLDDKIKDNEKLEFYDDTYRLCELVQLLNENELLDFTFEERSDQVGDSWLQCEYYSNKIYCSIIYDYSVNTIYEDLNQLADTLAEYQERISMLEKVISVPDNVRTLIIKL